MGSFLSKPLESLQVADILDFVAAMGDKYRDYLKDIEGNGIEGGLLAGLKDDQDFEDTVLDTLDIKNKLHRRALLIEWNNAKTRQEKKRKLLENTRQEQVDLTNTDIFHCPSKVPLPPFEKDKKPFMAPEGWLNKTRDVLLDNMNLQEGGSRPLPMAFVRCSRGGKTRATTEVIHLISTSCAAVYVSFNNETPMELQDYFKRPLEELCDRIGFAARKGDLLSLAWLDFRDRYQVNPKSVGAWLAKEKCILFIDELNLLPEVSVEVAKFLKTLFLVDEGRCFCFSSHLATTSTALAALLPTESNREIILRTLPLIPSLETARTSLNTPAISAREALYYGLIPGLLVERYKGRAPHIRRTVAVRRFANRMNLMAPSAARAQLRKLISSFITGNVESIPITLQELMTADVGGSNSVVVLRWIPFHMVYLLGEVREQCKLPDNVNDCLAAIVWAFDQFSTSIEESGDAWEAMFLVVLLVRCLSGIFEPKVLPLKNEVGNDVLVAYNKPWKGASFNGEQDPLNFIRCIPKDNPAEDGTYESIYGHPAPAGSEGGTYVSIYYPGHARFKAYDIIVAVWKGKDRQLHGYQLKEGSSATKGFAHGEAFDASYLIRGDAEKESKSIRLYQAVSEDELETFFGVSGNQWTPKRWKSIENAG